MNTTLDKSNFQVDYILIDCSSSMMDKWIESLGAVDTYIGEGHLKGVRSQVILHLFYDLNPDYIHYEGTNGDWQSIVDNRPEPQGMTPLYDAVNLMGRRLGKLDPEKASVVIVTDGGDNSSESTDAAQARGILDWLRAKGYQITFIGADFSNSHIAGMLGAKESESIGVQKRLLKDAAKSLAEKRARYGLTGAPMHWTEAEQQQFGGYLAPPKK